MDACFGREHLVGEVTSSPSAACFWVTCRLPIPWKLILTKFQLHLFNQLFDFCWLCAGCDFFGSWIVSGYESWRIHCHCEKSGSLQCLAAAALKRQFLQEFLIGTLYNFKFPFYRRYVNSNLPTEIVRYDGSVMYQGKHLIYIQFMLQSEKAKDIYISFFKDTVHYFNPTTCTLIMLCHSCKSLTEIAVSSCMRNTKKVLRKLLMYITWLDKSYYADNNQREFKRCRLFEKLMYKDCVFTFDDFPPQ
ncbi:E4 34K [Mastadenovirus eidoli]|uniref:E4 34K n=1 Tax=Eidolon helvum adenovirus TaxID=2039267 RepID=A0A348FKH9_9ADEN|nr:E4 34K [Eidolon helvum adenovirus]BBF72846.1 E4 34K [Eidolon helvum adenovirus]